MTKDDIANGLAIRAGLTKSQAIHAVEALTGILSEAFCSGQQVYLRGFGTFQIRLAKPKVGFDINRGFAVSIPARRAVKFKPCPALKAKMLQSENQ